MAGLGLATIILCARSSVAMNQQPKPQRTRRARGRSGRARRSGVRSGAPLSINNAPVSRNRPVRNSSQQNTLRKVGCSYIDVVETSTLADGSTIFDVLITPEVLPELAQVASTYQKIHYNRLTFELSAHMPTNSSGGYIMAFRPDPADKLPVEPLQKKQVATSTPGSVKDSIWVSRSLTVTAGNGRNANQCLPQRQFYTSKSADLRMYSPGSLWVIADGTINQAGNWSLSISWDVSLHVESYEPQVDSMEEIELVLGQNGYVYDGQTHIQSGDESGSPDLTWELAFPGIPKPTLEVTYYKLPITYGLTRSGEASQDIEYSDKIAYHLSVNEFRPLCFDGFQDAIFKSPTGNTQIFSKGMKWTIAENAADEQILNLTLSSRMLNLGPKRLKRLPSGGLSNRAYYEKSSKLLNPWISPLSMAR